MTEVRLLSTSGPVTAMRVLRPSGAGLPGSLSAADVSRVLQDLRRTSNRTVLLNVYALIGGSGGGPQSSANEARMLSSIADAVKRGRIAFVRGWSASGGATAAPDIDSGGTPTTDRQIVAAIMAGRSTIRFDGREYCLCEVGGAAGLRDRDRFQIVRVDEARDVLAGLASRSGTSPSAAGVYATAATKLRDRAPPGSEGGLFLLRQVQLIYRDAPVETEPPPSRPRPPPPPKLDITITFLTARSRRPLKDMPFKVAKPDGSVAQMKTTADGIIKLTGLDPGTCELTSIIQQATLATAFAEGDGIAGDVGGDDDDADDSDGDAGASATDAGGDGTGAGGDGTVAGGASGSAAGSASGGGSFGLGVSISVDALAHGDVAGAVKLTGTSSLQGSATASLSASATASLSGAALGSGSSAASSSPAGLGGIGGGGGGGAGNGAGGTSAGSQAAPDTSPISPAFLVLPEPHHVATGETTDSIASQTGVSWNDIANFNFETTDADALEDMFAERVGCTQTTPDGESYIFDDTDDPGVIVIPRPWTASFVVGQEYEVIAAPMRSIYISLENEDEIALPGAAFKVSFVDGTRRSGTLGRAGIARLDGVPEGPFAVTYTAPEDLLAVSLAASTRRAFDQQGTGPLFYLLGQEQEVIDSAVAVYQQYFNDLTGNGLAADIDQVVTDPDARVPLVFLCATAGIDIEGAADAIVLGDDDAAVDADAADADADLSGGDSDT